MSQLLHGYLCVAGQAPNAATYLSCRHRNQGFRPGLTEAERKELREMKKRIRLLEQENEGLRRDAAYLSQANLPGK